MMCPFGTQSSGSATCISLMPDPGDSPAAAYSISSEIKLLEAFGGGCGGPWVVAVSRTLFDWLPDVSSKQRTSPAQVNGDVVKNCLSWVCLSQPSP